MKKHQQQLKALMLSRSQNSHEAKKSSLWNQLQSVTKQGEPVIATSKNTHKARTKLVRIEAVDEIQQPRIPIKRPKRKYLWKENSKKVKLFYSSDLGGSGKFIIYEILLLTNTITKEGWT